MTDGQQICECAYCNRVGTVGVRGEIPDVEGFVCLGGMLLPSGRLRAICAKCTRTAVAAFARGVRK